MAVDYIPERDVDAATFMLTFAKGIAADPQRYALDAQIATRIGEAVALFRVMLARAGDPATRTRVSVRRKQESRQDAEQIVRRYAQVIRNDRDIPDADKIAIGVRPIARTRRRKIAVPAHNPRLGIRMTASGQHNLVFKRDADNVNAPWHKPEGAAALQLFVHIDDGQSDERPSHETARYVGTYTKAPVTVPAYGAAQGGKLATYFARWISRRGEEGPFSAAATMRIVA